MVGLSLDHRRLAAVVGVAVLAGTIVILQHRRGVSRADEEFRSHRPPALRGLGTTKRLTVLPLLDWHAARPDLKTEAGISYLVETDDITVLFDTGNNTQDADPAPLERTEAVFDAPLYGVIGGLHYPVPEGRMRMFGIDVQRRLASGIGPLAPLAVEGVRAEIALLKERDLGVVAVGGHDSSDEAIDWFRDAFGPAYRDVKVGQPIQIAP